MRLSSFRHGSRNTKMRSSGQARRGNQQSKGEALNAAIDHLADVEWLEERDPQKAIVVVVDPFDSLAGLGDI